LLRRNLSVDGTGANGEQRGDEDLLVGGWDRNPDRHALLAAIFAGIAPATVKIR
jgi:hypothetical protein